MQLKKSENKSEELATLSKPIQGAWTEGCTVRAVHAVQHQVLKLPQVADFATSQFSPPVSILVGQQGTQHEAFLCNSTQLAFNGACALLSHRQQTPLCGLSRLQECLKGTSGQEQRLKGRHILKCSFSYRLCMML